MSTKKQKRSTCSTRCKSCKNDHSKIDVLRKKFLELGEKEGASPQEAGIAAAEAIAIIAATSASPDTFLDGFIDHIEDCYIGLATELEAKGLLVKTESVEENDAPGKEHLH